MFSGSLLLTIALAYIHEVTLTAQKRVDAQWPIAEKERAAALLAIQPRLQQRQTAWQRALQRQTGRRGRPSQRNPTAQPKAARSTNPSAPDTW